MKYLKKSMFLQRIVYLLLIAGCRTPQAHVKKADKAAGAIIAKYQKDALGRAEPFSIEVPEDILRRRLIEEQNLPQLNKLLAESKAESGTLPDPLVISLVQALEIGARNSPEYQSQKESVFTAALDLDLAQDSFRNTYSALFSSLFAEDKSGDGDNQSLRNSFAIGLTRKLQTGATLSGKIGIDLVKLLTLDKTSTFGVFGDATITMPLLRGAGRDIVREPLTQAERNMIYAFWAFERFKGSYAVQIADSYFNALEQKSQIKNAEDNYNRISDAKQRAQALAEAGRSPETQVDQAYQDELRARTRVISAQRAYEQTLDSFKQSIGLPVDARIELDESELDRVAKETVDLVGAANGEADGLESEMEKSITVALKNRLDLMVVAGRLEDQRRRVDLARDALRAGAELKMSASTRKTSVSGGAAADVASEVGFGDGRYSAGLDVDLPWELTQKRNAYRESLLSLDQGERQLERQEDRIKQEVRGHIRGLVETRESYGIQLKAVDLAQKRVDSTQLFLNAGRSEMRDVLEAQEALVSAQNALMSAVVSYHVAVLRLRLDTGVLEVNERGIWYDKKE